MSERNTVQRQVILETLKSMDTHPSVDDLYSEIKKKHPSISKATVYRNIRQLVDKDIALQVAVVDDVSRYDGCMDFHHHFICNSCGKIYDLNIDNISDSKKLADSIQDTHGFKVDRSATSFFGVCLDCISSK